MDRWTTEIFAALVRVRSPSPCNGVRTSRGRGDQIHQESAIVPPVLNIFWDQGHLGSPDQGHHSARSRLYTQDLRVCCQSDQWWIPLLPKHVTSIQIRGNSQRPGNCQRPFILLINHSGALLQKCASPKPQEIPFRSVLCRPSLWTANINNQGNTCQGNTRRTSIVTGRCRARHRVPLTQSGKLVSRNCHMIINAEGNVLAYSTLLNSEARRRLQPLSRITILRLAGRAAQH